MSFFDSARRTATRFARKAADTSTKVALDLGKNVSDVAESARENLKDAAGQALNEHAPWVYVSERLVHPKTSDVVTLKRVPGYRQLQTYTCGYVAGMMVLHTFKPRVSENRFYERCRPDPDVGTTQRRLARALRDSGIRVKARDSAFSFDEIRRAIDAGRPLLVTVRTKDDSAGHWVVVYGYGENPRRVFVAGNRWPRLAARQELKWEAFVRERGGAFGGLVCSAEDSS